MNGGVPMPFMKTMEDALALCEKEQDNFYIDVFMIEAWLGHVALVVAGEYAEKKNAKDRAMQTGQAWRGFLEVFGHAKDVEWHHIYSSLLRFTEFDDVQAEILTKAIVALSFEHQCYSDYVGPDTMELAKDRAKAIALLKRTIERWCDWIDSILHFQTHFRYAVLPESFDSDPEKRELATLGIQQRAFPKLNPFAKKWWEWHHADAAEKFKNSGKWETIGKLASTPLRSPPNATDELAINLWPLVKRNNWTYRDFMAVIREVHPSRECYPLQREQEFATYCSNVLGLRKGKGAPGKSNSKGKPQGYEVALRLCGREIQSGSS